MTSCKLPQRSGTPEAVLHTYFKKYIYRLGSVPLRCVHSLKVTMAVDCFSFAVRCVTWANNRATETAARVCAEGGRVKAAGGIVSGGARVARVSNVFTEVGYESETGTALAQSARSSFPGLPLIGYERGEQLSHARGSGYQTAGALQVWIANT